MALSQGGGNSDGGFSYNPHVGINTEKAQFIFGYNAISKNGTFGWLELGGVIKL